MPQQARVLIQSPGAAIRVSVARVRGTAIKHSPGRRDMPASSHDAVRHLHESGYRFLAVEARHAVAGEELAAHHHDPFDGILVVRCSGSISAFAVIGPAG